MITSVGMEEHVFEYRGKKIANAAFEILHFKHFDASFKKVLFFHTSLTVQVKLFDLLEELKPVVKESFAFEFQGKILGCGTIWF